MSTTTLYALFAFALVSSITPGPNNILLMTSGANHGFKKTIPHMLGVYVGFILMVAIIGFGASDLFKIYPNLQKVLQMMCGSYLLVLAFKIGFSTFNSQNQEAKKPMSFVEAAVFQWINPKAWTMAISAVTIYSGEHTLSLLAILMAFSLMNLPSITVWVFAGLKLKGFLENERRLRIFNIVMALLLISSLYPIYLV